MIDFQLPELVHIKVTIFDELHQNCNSKRRKLKFHNAFRGLAKGRPYYLSSGLIDID